MSMHRHPRPQAQRFRATPTWLPIVVGLSLGLVGLSTVATVVGVIDPVLRGLFR